MAGTTYPKNLAACLLYAVGWWHGRTYLVFGDIEGKLDVLRVECTKCDRKGRYSVAKIEKHGRKANLMVWREMLNGDCPKRDARIQDRCDLICPDLPKVL